MNPGVHVLYPAMETAIWSTVWRCLAYCGVDQEAARDAVASGAKSGSYACPGCGAMHILGDWDGEPTIALEADLADFTKDVTPP